MVGRGRLHYYDAAAPIVATDSIDLAACYKKSRYDKGDGEDYLNIPLDREQYRQFIDDLRALPKHDPKDFELDVAAGKIPYFEGCLPIEEMAARGEDALRFGPLKPVGLRDPRTGAVPYAVVQLRNEDAAGSAMNLVGFQTRLTWPAQKEAFGKLPGLQHAEWLRLGVMHRNTFIDAPRAARRATAVALATGPLFCRSGHRRRRLRRSGRVRDDRRHRGRPASARRRTGRRPRRHRARRGDRALAERGVARLPARQRDLDVVLPVTGEAAARQTRATRRASRAERSNGSANSPPGSRRV